MKAIILVPLILVGLAACTEQKPRPISGAGVPVAPRLGGDNARDGADDAKRAAEEAAAEAAEEKAAAKKAAEEKAIKDASKATNIVGSGDTKTTTADSKTTDVKVTIKLID